MIEVCIGARQVSHSIPKQQKDLLAALVQFKPKFLLSKNINH
jgi:hypothetical protein